MGVDVVTQYQNGQAVISDSIVCVNYHETFKIVIALVGFSSLDFISISAQVDPREEVSA